MCKRRDTDSKAVFLPKVPRTFNHRNYFSGIIIYVTLQQHSIHGGDLSCAVVDRDLLVCKCVH